MSTPGYKYEFNEKYKIMYKYYYGDISLGMITNSWNWAIQNQIIPPDTAGFLLDYRLGHLQVSIAELSGISTYYRTHPELFLNKRIAIVTENPRDVVVPILVSEKDSGYQSRPFSTTKAGINWILNR